MVDKARRIDRCQICGEASLRPILFLGYIPPVNAMEEVGSPRAGSLCFPLELVRCESCTLVQIDVEVAPEILFPRSYPYRSGTTGALRRNFCEQADEARRVVGLQEGDLVVDIGSNDGTLLANYLESGCRVLGVEPSDAALDARARGIETVQAYFGKDVGRRLVREYGRAKLVTACNVFAHVGDVHGMLGGIVELLEEDGVFLSESHYLSDLLRTVQYDTIYHEHLRYYSLSSLDRLLEAHGLEVFHVTRIPTHGGSIRVYAARRGTREMGQSVRSMRESEREEGILSGAALDGFAERVRHSKLALYETLAPLVRQGARIYGVGAPSRSSTLINYTGLDDGILSCIVEVPGSPKIGKYVPGTRIPVVDEHLLYEDQPEYALILSWHIAREVTGNLRDRGYRGSFLVPLPHPAEFKA